MRAPVKRRAVISGTLAATALALVGCTQKPTTEDNVAKVAATVAALKSTDSTATTPGATTTATGATPAARPSAPASTPSPRTSAAAPTAASSGAASPTPTLVPAMPTLTPTPKPPTPTPVVKLPPRSVVIPKIGVSAPIVKLGVLPTGDMEAPNGPDDVGWFAGGPKPGEPGNAILTAHLDWHGPPPRPAVFWRLKELAPGDEVLVTNQKEQLVFEVESTKVYDRDSAPVEQILGFAVGQVITLLTCEGQFIRGDYTERRVVRARLA